jgi:hypothetical protein
MCAQTIRMHCELSGALQAFNNSYSLLHFGSRSKVSSDKQPEVYYSLRRYVMRKSTIKRLRTIIRDFFFSAMLLFENGKVRIWGSG